MRCGDVRIESACHSPGGGGVQAGAAAAGPWHLMRPRRLLVRHRLQVQTILVGLSPCMYFVS